MKIGFLGPKGSFSHHVAQEAFPADTLVAFENITEVVKAYEIGEVDYSVVPVENSIEGSVHEVVQPIQQQLLVTATDKPVEKIFSHPQAIAQGKKYIRQHYPQAKIEITASTAYAARFVAQHPEENYAAIAPKTAASEYSLQIIAEDIQEMDENFTRFWLLGQSISDLPLYPKEKKMTLALTLPDNLPGALYKALATFAWRGIDLTKIESRPLKTALGEYFFIVDINNEKANLVSFAIKELETIGITYKILGNYTVYTISEK